MKQQWPGVTSRLGAAALVMVCLSCKAAPLEKPFGLGPVNDGPGSMEATRRGLEGTWTLASLEAVDAAGVHRPVKATGQLTYDAYGNMIIKGVIQDATATQSITLDYEGKIIIDNVRKQFYPADLESAQPVDPAKIAAIAPDKVRRYELTMDSFVVTYIDAAGKPTAVAKWRR